MSVTRQLMDPIDFDSGEK